MLLMQFTLSPCGDDRCREKRTLKPFNLPRSGLLRRIWKAIWSSMTEAFCITASGNMKRGIGGLREHFQQLLRGFPDLRIDSQDIFGDDEKVAHRFTFYGTHRGDFMGYAATNKFIVSPGVLLHTFQRGKCVEVWQLLDNLRFLAAFGAVPESPKARPDPPAIARK